MDYPFSALSRDAVRALSILAEAANFEGNFPQAPETILIVQGNFTEERAHAIVSQLEDAGFLLFYIDGQGETAFFRLDVGMFARHFMVLEAIRTGRVGVSHASAYPS